MNSLGSSRRWKGVLTALLASAAFVACAGEADVSPAVDEPEYDGLSREQIEIDAESMTPAEAERLGIVDTTIRIEPPMSPDSVVQDEPLVP